MACKYLVIHLLESTSVSYGGPALTVSRLIQRNSDSRFEFRVISLEAGGPCNATPAESYATQAGKAIGLLNGAQPGVVRVIWSVIKNTDRRVILHLHNFWNLLPLTAFMFKLIFGRRVELVYSIRGSLSVNSFKKKVAWLLYQKKIFKSSLFIHATNESDYKLISNLNRRCVFIPNGVDKARVFSRPTHCKVSSVKNSPFEILFVGRIHAHKGLHILLEALSGVSKPLRLVVIGSTNDTEYLKRCEYLVSVLPPHVECDWVGVLDHESIDFYYRKASVFCLPTLSENFGNSMAEALAHGTPIMFSGEVPWDWVAEAGGGWRFERSVHGLRSALEQIFSLSEESFSSVQRNAEFCGSRLWDWEKVSAEMVRCYEAYYETGR